MPASIIRKELDYPNSLGRKRFLQPQISQREANLVISTKSRGKILQPSSDGCVYKKTSLKSLQQTACIRKHDRVKNALPTLQRSEKSLKVHDELL